jgi:hypothetical protein
MLLQAYHRELLEQRQRALKNQQPPALTDAALKKPALSELIRNPPRKLAPVKRPKDRKSGSRKHRQKATNSFQ